MNEHPSPEFEKELRETFSASGADPAFVHDLRATLLERSKMKAKTRMFSRLAWGVALAILLIGLLVASPQVVEALRRLLGYIPGVGYVEQGSSLRILAAPAALKKDGLRLTIEKGAADSGRTILLGHIEGYTPDRHGDGYCETPARLILPDGSILAQVQSETSMTGTKGSPTGSYYARYTFEPMPEGQPEATLEIPCLMQDQDFRDWKLAIQFDVGDGTQVMPVIELPTAPDAPVPTDPLTAPVSPAESTVEGFTIVLESETPLPDGYILSGSYQWTDPRFEFFSIQIIDPQITDADGQPVAFTPVDPLTPFDPALKKLPFAFQISGKDYASPLTITVDALTVNLPDKGTFQFDAGPNPQAGQKWEVDIDVPVGEHVIHVQTIELTAGRTPTELGFTFTMTAAPHVMGASIDDSDPAVQANSGGGGGGGGGSTEGPSTYGWALEGYSSAGVKTFVVSNVAVVFEGPWQVTWEPKVQ